MAHLRHVVAVLLRGAHNAVTLEARVTCALKGAVGVRHALSVDGTIVDHVAGGRHVRAVGESVADVILGASAVLDALCRVPQANGIFGTEGSATVARWHTPWLGYKRKMSKHTSLADA